MHCAPGPLPIPIEFLKGLNMWPFKTKAKTPRIVPIVSYIDAISFAGMAQPISSQIAENLGGIAACVSLISGTIAGLPAPVTKQEGPNRREPAPTHALSKIIRNGSNGMMWSDLIGAWVADALLLGNGLLRIVTDDRTGRLIGLEWLPWSRVICGRLSSGAIVYDYTTVFGQRERYLAGEVAHLRDRLDPAMPWVGKSRIARSPGVVTLANTLHASAQSFSGNIARPGGLLTAPGKISDDTANRLQRDFDQNFSGKRTGKTAVLGEGLEFKQLANVDAQSSQLVEQLLWNLQECARIYGVPPQLIGDLSASTFTNSAQASRMLAVFCLQPWTEKINATLRGALLDAPFDIELDLSELMRGDTETYFKSLALFRNSAIITANEARLATGFDEHPSPAANDLMAVQQGGKQDDKPAADEDDAAKAARLRVVS